MYFEEQKHNSLLEFLQHEINIQKSEEGIFAQVRIEILTLIREFIVAQPQHVKYNELTYIFLGDHPLQTVVCWERQRLSKVVEN